MKYVKKEKIIFRLKNIDETFTQFEILSVDEIFSQYYTRGHFTKGN